MARKSIAMKPRYLCVSIRCHRCIRKSNPEPTLQIAPIAPQKLNGDSSTKYCRSLEWIFLRIFRSLHSVTSDADVKIRQSIQSSERCFRPSSGTHAFVNLLSDQITFCDFERVIREFRCCNFGQWKFRLQGNLLATKRQKSL
jgi:hypothetical protein